jgi:hypothetical protein
MKPRGTHRAASRLLLATAALAAGVIWFSDALAAPSRPKTPAPERRHAVVKGSAGPDVRFVGDLKRAGPTRWCGHLEVGVRQPDSGDLQVEQRDDSGRECGTIAGESVVMLTLACPRAIGVGGVLRGRPRLQVKRADGRIRSVPLKRIRDVRDGTFFSTALVAEQLPATIRIAGGPTIADVPAVGEVC